MMKIVDYILIGILCGLMNVVATFPADASSVVWFHGVNSKRKLKEALAGNTQFLEADVSLGNVTGSTSEINVPIMAHSPGEKSDISLSNWIKEVISANWNKGVKLDFKLSKVVEPSLKILQKHKNKIKFRLWLNADILPGPVDSTTVPVNSTQFISLGHQYFPQSTLSFGWTTNYKGKPGNYSWYNVKSMTDTLKCSNVNQLMTFSVRSVFVSNSVSQLIWLLDLFPTSTLTVWSTNGDPVHIDDLLILRSFASQSRIYYDLHAELNKLFQDWKYVKPVVRYPGFTNKNFTVFGDKESCTNTVYVTLSAIMFTGQQKGIIFNEIVRNTMSTDISGKIHFITTSSLSSEISLQLFVGRANAFSQHSDSEYISIPSDFDVYDTLMSSAVFSHRFTSTLGDQEFELYLSQNGGSINIIHKTGEGHKSIKQYFNYDVDAMVISFVSDGGSSLVYDAYFISLVPA